MLGSGLFLRVTRLGGLSMTRLKDVKIGRAYKHVYKRDCYVNRRKLSIVRVMRYQRGHLGGPVRCRLIQENGSLGCVVDALVSELTELSKSAKKWLDSLPSSNNLGEFQFRRNTPIR